MGFGKGGDDGEQIALEQQQYQDTLQESQEQVDKVDKEELGFLHSQGGLAYDNPDKPA